MTEAKTTYDLPFADYAYLPGLSATALKAGVKSMLHMRHTIKGPGREDTPALAWGRVVHAAILEPERVLSRLVVWTGGRRAGEEWKDFQSVAERGGLEIINVDQRQKLEDTIRAVHASGTAQRMIECTRHEVTIQWGDPMLGECKARLDGFNEGVGLIEVKTTRNIDPRSFGGDFFRLGYDIQSGWYWRAVYEAFNNLIVPVHVIAVDTSGDSDICVYEVPENIVRAGYAKARELALRYRACQAVGSFPGVANGVDILPLEVPTWILNNEAAAMMPTEEMEATEL